MEENEQRIESEAMQPPEVTEQTESEIMQPLETGEASAPPQKQYTRKCVALLLFLSWLAYTAGNVGRMNYSASMVAIIEETGAKNTAAGLVSSFFFFAYGAGQLVNGLLCHKYNSRLFIFGSLLLAAAANFCLPFCASVSAMKWLWLLNGVVQSVLWSSLVKLQAEYLNEKDVGKSIIVMSTTTAAGTFIAYGISALNVAFFSWRVTFYIAAILLAAAGVAWLLGMGYVQKTMPKFAVNKSAVATSGKRISAPIVVSLCLVCAFAVANGFVKDGVNTWTPKLLCDVHSIESHYAIIFTMVLPLVSIFGAYIAKLAYKKIPNDVLLISIFFAVGGGVAALILWLYARTLFGTVALFAVVSCMVAAVNNLITAAIPFRLRTVGRSGFFAGVLNTFCYVGSTITSVLLGGIATSKGWNAVILLLMCALLVLSSVALVFSLYWKKKITPLL